MIRHFLAGAALLACSLIFTPALAAPTVGKPAPDFTATDALSGESVTLSELKGKLVVLEWNNPLCPFVKKFYSVGAMQQLQANATGKGVVWISINSNAPGKEGAMPTDADAQNFVTEKAAKPTYYLRDPDGTIGKQYEAKTTPHMFVIDRDGTLAYMGAIDNTPTADSADIATAKNYVTRALTAVTNGKKPAVTATRPYGCFVKYAD